jgi:hypothetical protein
VGRQRRSLKVPFGVAFWLIVAAMLLGSVTAEARPPVLTSVGQDTGRITATWSLPDQVQSRFIEISTTPTVVGPGQLNAGYFTPQGNVKSFAAFHGSETSFKDQLTMPPGTYYVHVAGEDFSCHFSSCPGREFSEIMAVSFSGPGVGSGGGGGGGGGGSSDKRSPAVTLSAGHLQRVGRLKVAVKIDEPGSVAATAKVNTSQGAASVYRFRSGAKKVKANVRATLRLKISKRKLAALKRVLRKHKRLDTSVTVTARDRAGNASVQKLKIRVKK